MNERPEEITIKFFWNPKELCFEMQIKTHWKDREKVIPLADCNIFARNLANTKGLTETDKRFLDKIFSRYLCIRAGRMSYE